MRKEFPITAACVALLLAGSAGVAAMQDPSPDGAAPPMQTTPDEGKADGPSRDGTYRIGHDVKPPKATYEPDPDYSDEARRAKYQARVYGWWLTPTARHSVFV